MDQIVAGVGGLAALGAVPIDEPVDTGQFAEEIEAGNWGRSHGEVWRRARAIHDRLRGLGDVRVVYAGGMPEVAHAIAFGAYLEELWPLEFYDFHDGHLVWPVVGRTLDLRTVGLPQDMMTTAGPAVLRLEISYRVEDAAIEEFVPSEQRVADIRIGPSGRDAAPGLVRSMDDVEEVRRAIREAVFALVERRPKLSAIHLFAAAPVSACVVLGQELRLRNHPIAQTYRHRRRPDGTVVMTEALRLTAIGPELADVPLSPAQSARATALRSELWAAAITDVEAYAGVKERQARERERGARERWYDSLPWSDEWRRVRPFPALPPVHDMVKRPAAVADSSFDGEGFGFLREERLWRINDGFSVRLEEQFHDEHARRVLARIFLLHEYLHEVHGITKESYRQVGKFPNCLERADYMCDLYGVLHEFDLETAADGTILRDFDRCRVRVAELIDLVLRSYWVFERPGPLAELEVRRIRRYMNWYWQQVRVRRSESALQLAAVLARQPVIEVAGLATRAEGRRHYASLRRLDRDVGLELAVILDSEQLFRIKSGVNTPIEELMAAFRDHRHDDIRQFFRQAFAEAESTGHALPREADLP